MIILNLILYNDTPVYKDMKDVLTQYLNTKTTNVIFLFYCYKEIDEPYKIEDNVLYIRGKETFLPGILTKTIEAFDIGLKNYKFDYLVRTNISTIMDVDLLLKHLQKNNITYGGAHLENLQWLDKNAGIHTHQYRGTKYIQGTGIILSRKYAQLLIDRKNEINYDIIDDVSIGLFFKKYIEVNKIKEIGQFNNAKSYIKDKIFYRNKSSKRENDVINMKNIIDGINKNN